MSGDASGKPTPSFFSRFAKIFLGKEKIVFVSPLLSLRLLVRQRMPFCFSSAFSVVART